MSNKFGDWLGKILLEKGKSQNALARETGLSPTQVNNYVNGKSFPRRKQIQKIAQSLAVSADFVARMAGYGTEKSDLTEKEEAILFSYRSLPEQMKNAFQLALEAVSQVYGQPPEPPMGRIRLLGRVGAGEAIEMNLDEEVEVPQVLLSDNRFVLQVVGDSMSPVANNGDYVIIENCKQPIEGKPCVFQIEGNGALLKKWKKQGQKIVLISTNPKYPARVEPGSKVKCDGWMVEVVKKNLDLL